MLINYHDRRFWNATPIPIITLGLLYSIEKAKTNTRWFILTAVLIGVSFHIHLTLLLFLLPVFFVFLGSWKKVKISTWVLAIGAYLIITSPLLVFDAVHNFDNLLMPYRVITGQQKTELYAFTPANTLSHVGDLTSSLGRLWFIGIEKNPMDEVVMEAHANKTQGNLFLGFLSFVFFVLFVLRYRKTNKIIILSLFIVPVSFIVYPSYNPEYYLMSFLTLMTIVIGDGLARIPKAMSVLILSLFLMSNMVSTLSSKDTYGLTIRKQLVEKAMRVVGDQSYELVTYGERGEKYYDYAGWRFMFKIYGKTSSRSNIDTLLGWIYPDELSEEVPELKVIVADTIEPKFDQEPIATFSNGPYRSYVFINN